jgi:3-phytase
MGSTRIARRRARCAAAAVLGVTVAACAGDGAGAPASEERGMAGQTEIAVIDEVFETPADTLDNVDSPAVWHGPDGQVWLLATAKEGNVIRVSDAGTGEPLTRVGGTGDGPGELRRPNGIAVVDDLLIIVERDNRRVQVFSLPDFEPLGVYGEEELELPYGIAVHPEGPGQYVTYITDAYELENEETPPDSLLDRRVHQFRLRVQDGAVAAEHVRAFGETSGEGVLHSVESLALDVVHGRLLVAEEEEGDSKIMVYTLDGRFTGDVIPASFFPNQAEGIVLYGCGEDDGYWVATDQGDDVNTFHVFDRVTFAHLGSFRGRTVRNTDGIALTQRSYPEFPGGAFFAVHDDRSTVAFRWADIAGALGLRTDCEAGDAR